MLMCPINGLQVVAPTLDNPGCKEQVSSSCREVAAAVQELVGACEAARRDHDLKNGLNMASREVRGFEYKSAFW